MTDEAAVPEGPRTVPAQGGQRLTAAAQFPFPAGPDQAALALQGQLRTILLEQLVDEPGQPMRVMNWNTLTVEGPVEDVDPSGRTWFVYLGTANSRQLRPIDPPPGPTSNTPVRLGTPPT